jgi:predicted PurR-regulated permease PerM
MLQTFGVKKLFEKNWEKMVLWAIMVGLFYLLKSFLLLIFETFLLTYIGKRVVRWGVQRLNMNHRVTTVIVFMIFVTALGAIGTWITPRLIIESNRLLTDLAGSGEQQTREKINRFTQNTINTILGAGKLSGWMDTQEYNTMMDIIKAEFGKAVKSALPHIFETLMHIVAVCWEILLSLLLAIIFSFILVLDWERIARSVRELEKSRIHSFYVGAAPHLQAFAAVLGRAFTAQAIIATCNTVLTVAGIWFFNVPNIALISVIVFFCGFIPIAGTFLSSIPIVLFGIQVGGVPLVLKLILLIAIVHAFEAYILNPNITGNVLHIHPLLVLVLLLLGERFFGVWGMVAGVPVGYYVISVVTRRDEAFMEDTG